jgi:hypothetical protein
MTFYTYRAQLTFGLSRTCSKVNVAALFLQWYEKSHSLLSNFSLLPYDEDQGQQITSPDQIMHDSDFFSKYFYNHRVLQTGNLTGMVHFQTNIPWISLKSYRSKYFAWLKECRVYLNHMKFKTDTLVACGFLVGSHPGHLWWDEAEEELRESLEIDSDQLPFQLSSCSISVPIKEGSTNRYSFQAVVVETSTQYASTLREKFYALDHPSTAREIFPYTGMYQFVPITTVKGVVNW